MQLLVQWTSKSNLYREEFSLDVAKYMSADTIGNRNYNEFNRSRLVEGEQKCRSH